MEAETKLDEDFLFYLSFANTFLKRITDEEVHQKCEQWLEKLCGCTGGDTNKKRCRNLYLSNLLLTMQKTKLDGPFDKNPLEVDIMDAMGVFEPIPVNLEKPDWLEESTNLPKPPPGCEFPEKQGRTYVATKTLPKGQGAFAYIGVSMSEQEPAWMDDNKCCSLEECCREKQAKIEKLLAKRKPTKDRERVMIFYDILIQTILEELEGKDSSASHIIEGLIEQLVQDLKAKNQYCLFNKLEEFDKRQKLLNILLQKVESRRNAIATRSSVLDDVEIKMDPDFDDFEAGDKYELPAAMWEMVINKAPSMNNLIRLQETYPCSLIETFLNLLSNHKEQIAVKMQKAHDKLVTQMKEELKIEAEQRKKETEEVQQACDQAEQVLSFVRERYEAIKEAEAIPLDRTFSESEILYQHIKSSLDDTQKNVEEEAKRGAFLTEQIQILSEQSRKYIEVNDMVTNNTLEVNVNIEKNLKRLEKCLEGYKDRLVKMKKGNNEESGDASRICKANV